MNIAKIVLFLLAGLLLGVSVNKGFVNPALEGHAFMAVLILLVVFVLVLKAGTLQRSLSRMVFETSERLFLSVLFVAGVSAYSIIAWKVFQATPHLDDSVAALFQAKIFAAGKAVLPLPELADFFIMTGMIDVRHGLDHMASMYPPGYPALFVPGLLLGIPWITNPLLGAGLVLIIYGLAKELYGLKTARVAGLLALSSPFLALQAGTYLSHIPTAFMLTLCMWAVCRLLRTGCMRYGALAGLGFGVAFLGRPLTALLIGLVIALAPLFYVRKSLRAWKGVVVAGLLAALAAGTLAAFQQVVTGDYRTPGHEVGLGDRGKMGFGRLDKSVTHTPDLGWDHTRYRLRALNHKVLGWPIPLFLVALLPFLLFRAGKKELWLLLPAISLLLVYFTFWYYEFFYEARYIFSGIPMLFILSARGVECLLETLGPRLKKIPIAVVVSCVAFQLLVYFPQYVRGFSDRHGDVEAVLPKVISACSITNAIVFMDGKGRLPEHTTNNPRNNFYATGFIRNNITFDGDVIYARNIRGRNHQLAKRYPDKTCYLYVYDRGSNKAWLFALEFDGRVQMKELVEPTLETPFLWGE